MTSVYVPPGNWTNNVNSSLGDNSVSGLHFEVMFGNGSPDPAPGCPKSFTATYKCGDFPQSKSLNLKKSADGKYVYFNCEVESATCNNLKLTLTDDAKLTLTNWDGSKTYWDSVTAFGDKGSISLKTIMPPSTMDNIPETAPLTVPDYAGNGVPNANVDVGTGGGSGRRYPYNYLESGQFLEYGQWIGSPSGTCRLIMGTPDDPNSLKVVKNILGCTGLDEPVKMATTTKNGITDLGCWKDDTSDGRALTGYPQRYMYSVQSCAKYAADRGRDIFSLQNEGWCATKLPSNNYKKYGPAEGSCPELGGYGINHVYGMNQTTTSDVNADPNAARLYTLPVKNDTIGKVAYINNRGQLQLYPDATMTMYNNEYEKIGNYNMSTGAELGTAVKTADIDACEASCNEGNGDSQKCAGFVFDTTTARCQLLDKNIYNKNRIIDSNYEYKVRQKIATGHDISCPTDVTEKMTDFWQKMDIASEMAPETKCGLANFTQKERAAVANKLPEVYNNLEYKDINGDVADDIEYKDLSGNQTLITKNKNGFRYWYESLQAKYEKLADKLFNTNATLKSTFAELHESRQNLADWTGEQLQNLEAMNEDRDLNMMSQNYRHIMWSILAILIIMTTMKFTKSIAAKGASA